MRPSASAPRSWLSAIPEADLAMYREGGFMAGVAMGRRPALLVVDVTFGFTGSPGRSLAEAMSEFPTACGPVAWEAMPRIARLLDLFRTRSMPVIFTCNDLVGAGFAGTTTKSKSHGAARPGFNAFPAEIAPREGEWVLAKTKASAFFQTPLISALVREEVDCLVVCGVSTSGCVRATVVDGFSHGFPTFVVDDCCFDRSWFSHCANLLDMQAKYAAVVPLAELERLLPESVTAERAN